jgi:uncharacterized protein YdcH (DUF465 family)
MSDLYTSKGRYTVWGIDYHSKNIREIRNLYINKSDRNEDLESIEYLSKKLFDKYKIYQPEIMEGDDSGVYLSYRVVGKTNMRKRLSTLNNEHERIFEDYNELENVINTLEGYSIYHISDTFEKTEFNGTLISSSDSASEYTGSDVNKLDDPQVRYPWQQEVLSFFYDEKKEDFLEPDDRAIYWIYDKKGATGKSKFIKWICINRPEDVVKIIFGTSSQLSSALISAGARKCYFIDMPRTLPKENKLDSMIATIEDLKNGHLVSVRDGQYNQLVMSPPYIIIFSNQKCPVNLASKERWRYYEIIKSSLTLKELRI